MVRIGAATILLIPLLASGCATFGSDDPAPSREGSASPPAVTGSAPSGELQASPTSEITAPHVVGNRAYGLPEGREPRRLAGTVNAPFSGTLAPAAVPRLDDPGTIAYHAFHAGRPVLRQYDATRRRDAVIATGAFSIAWRRDATLAYFKGLTREVGDPSRYRGHLVVRNRLGDPPVRWTSRPGRYVAAAWAGDHLLAYRLSRLSADVLAFDGPRRARVLARNAFLVAVSPDGRQAFTSRPAAPGATVRVRDVATGASTAQLSLRGDGAPDAEHPTTFVASGSWSGDRVVGATNLGLVVFRIEPDRIALEQTLAVDLTVYPTSLQEPRLDPSGRRIVAWADLAAKPRQAIAETALVECDRMTLHCRQGPSAPGLEAPRLVYNPSRP
jgi:hypothetical protein